MPTLCASPREVILKFDAKQAMHPTQRTPPDPTTGVNIDRSEEDRRKPGPAHANVPGRNVLLDGARWQGPAYCMQGTVTQRPASAKKPLVVRPAFQFNSLSL